MALLQFDWEVSRYGIQMRDTLAYIALDFNINFTTSFLYYYFFYKTTSIQTTYQTSYQTSYQTTSFL